MSVLEHLFGIESMDDPTAKMADQLIKRYMMAETEKDVTEKGMDMVFGHDKADNLESKLDIALKRRQLGMEVDTSELGEPPSALRRLAPYAALAAGTKLLGSPLLGRELSSIFGSKTGGLAQKLGNFAHGGSEPSASIIADLLRRRA